MLNKEAVPEENTNHDNAWAEVMEEPIALKVDLLSPEYTKKFEDAAIYQKVGEINAVQIDQDALERGDYADKDVRFDDDLGKYVVDTYVMQQRDGKRVSVLEDTHVVEAGDWLATNPVRQEGDKENNYPISNETFQKRYKSTIRPGVFRPKGLAKIIRNDTERPVEIDAPWGGIQAGDEACYFCAQCDETGQLVGERYILSENDFATYELVETESA